ncbi:hypothetical protein PMZ80_007618 [Knufia obscura]|uniref:Major facilitator superfamily (MFS) profile domain-containing protein n=1 Tax=Knufia obscura TaxID=1635080 RepID=A0ABR0RHU1_9EURO|nr:hypothetical protein PMZ80_007618 [Knufia obscura]
MAISDLDRNSGKGVTEKHEYATDDVHAGHGLTATNQPDYHDKETKRILRKVDYRLLPMLTLLYVLAFLDRGNIGNAKIAGMMEDLELTGPQYNIALTVFFLPYAVFEVPSNIVLKLMRPSWWICILMVSWGVVMTLQGIVKDYHGLIITRTMLGLTESGFFPAATFLLTTWYCRFEVQTRLSIFFSAASLAGAFSGLLAYGIQHMAGVGGLNGWRWIFILEGIATVVVGVTLPWTLPDSPESASFLTPEEKALIKHRLEEDSGTAAGRVGTSEGFQWKYLIGALTEWKIYLAVIIYWGNAISLYGFTYSAPTIIKGLGYTSANAQLLTIPVYLLGVISTISFSMMADKHQKKWPFIVANLAPSWKRAVGMALLISIGNLGGAIGSNIFLANQAPDYWLGYGMGCGMVSAAIVCTMILKTALEKINKQRDAMDENEIRAKYTEAQLIELGDKSPLFRYVV